GVDRLERVALGVDVLGIAALGIARAGQERPARPLAQDHRLAALIANMLGRLAGQDRFTLRIEVHGRLAVGVTPASPEGAALTHAFEHRLAAFRAQMLGHFRGRPCFLTLARLDVLAAFFPARATNKLVARLLAVLNDERFAALRTVLARLLVFLGRHLG